jgi:hypothetical protein
MKTLEEIADKKNYLCYDIVQPKTTFGMERKYIYANEFC